MLCVFLRAPNLGQVKSRLAATIGEAQALAAHIRLVDHLLDQLGLAGSSEEKPSGANRFEVELWLADKPNTQEASALVQAWAQRTGLPLRQQQGADLGARMAGALADCVARGKLGVLVGSDCPTIDGGYIEQAIDCLQSGADVVLGPAEDGGYGLVGVTQAQPDLFQQISWGTNQVLRQTLAAAHQLALNVHQLETLWDVDYLADWQRFGNSYG